MNEENYIDGELFIVNAVDVKRLCQKVRDRDKGLQLMNQALANAEEREVKLRERDEQWRTKWERTVDSLAKCVLSKGDLEAEIAALKGSA